MLAQFKPVEISWRDSTQESGWLDVSNPLAPIYATSIGFVLEDNLEYIKITSTLAKESASGDFSGMTFNQLVIPKACIDSIWDFEKHTLIYTKSQEII